MTESQTATSQLLRRLVSSGEDIAWAASLVQPWQHTRIEGEWTPHEHVFHLLANERVFQERIRQAIGEEEPAFVRWDSLGFMAENYRPEPGITELAAEFSAARAVTFDLFQALAPQQFSRTATWPDGTTIDLAWFAEKVLWHGLDHFATLLDMHGEFAARQYRP